MMKKHIAAILMLALTVLSFYSQAQPPGMPPPPPPVVKKKRNLGTGVAELTKMGRKALIKMGIEILKKEGLEVYDYEVNVVANQHFLEIRFYHPITYLPQNAIYEGSHRLVFASNKFQKRRSRRYKNPFNTWAEKGKVYPAYRQTNKGKKIIRKIVASINRYDKERTQKLNLKTLGNNFTVQEKDTFYKVDFAVKFKHYTYKITKDFSKILAKKAPPPPPRMLSNDPYKEIKD